MPTAAVTSKPIGFALIDMAFPADAQRAMNELNGRVMLNRRVHIQLAQKPAEATPIQAAVASGAATRRLHVGNLDEDTTKKELEDFFKRHHMYAHLLRQNLSGGQLIYITVRH